MTPMGKIIAQIKKAVAALAVVVVAGGRRRRRWTNYYQTNVRVQQVHPADLTTCARHERAGAGHASRRPNSLRQAAFAVILEDTNGRPQVIGTAWPLQAGMLVTNAHVAEVMDSLKPGERLLVRKLGATDDIP